MLGDNAYVPTPSTPQSNLRPRLLHHFHALRRSERASASTQRERYRKAPLPFGDGRQPTRHTMASFMVPARGWSSRWLGVLLVGAALCPLGVGQKAAETCAKGAGAQKKELPALKGINAAVLVAQVCAG